MKEVRKKSKNEIVAICHNLRSANNVGSIFRTADGAGVKKIFLSGYTSAPPHSGISKTALGAEQYVKWERVRNISKLLQRLKKEKFSLVALEQDRESIDYLNFRKKRRVALVLGNEVRGLSQVILEKCDKIIEIPMRGKKESLNVAVAFGIAVYSLNDI